MAFQIPAVAATTATTASSAATASAAASTASKPIPVTTAPPPPPTPPPVVANAPTTPVNTPTAAPVEPALPVETAPPEVAGNGLEGSQATMKDLQTAQYVISKVGEAGGAVIRGLSYKTERDGDASIARQFELREEAQDIKYGAQESAYLYQLAGVKNATAIASVNAMTSSTGPRGNYNRGNPVKV